jgi:hypothetical protein
MEQKNREQRRQEQFGGGRSTGKGGWPTSEPNPAFGGGGEEGAQEATAGRPDKDQTKLTGAGAGGATEHADRMPEHEGTHGQNSAKG